MTEQELMESRLLTSEEILDIEDDIKDNLPDGAGHQEFLATVELAVARKQDMISFKAGKQKVAKWVELHTFPPHYDTHGFVDFDKHYLVFSLEEWQAFKKREGL